MSTYKTYILQNKSVTKWNKAKLNNKEVDIFQESKNFNTVINGNHQEVVDRYQIRTDLGISAVQYSVSLQLPAKAKTAFSVAVNHDRYAKKHRIGTKSVFTKEAEGGHNYTIYASVSLDFPVSQCVMILESNMWSSVRITAQQQHTRTARTRCQTITITESLTSKVRSIVDAYPGKNTHTVTHTHTHTRTRTHTHTHAWCRYVQNRRGLWPVCHCRYYRLRRDVTTGNRQHPRWPWLQTRGQFAGARK